MLRYLRPLLFGLLAAVTIPVAFAADNCGGCKDYPGISRMPGYDITSYEESPFAAFDFPVTENGKQVKRSAEGHKYFFRYSRGPSSQAGSLQVARNYQNAARAAGGAVLYDDNSFSDRFTTFRIAGPARKCGSILSASTKVRYTS